MADFLTDADFEKIKTLIYNESGITFSTTNRSILEGRLKEILRNKNMEKISEYYALITSNKEEMKLLLDSVTTNLTRFFRNLPHFETLINYIIPDLVKSKKAEGNHKIQIWSAGCSTGEEPYTIAMIMKKHLPPTFSAEILASDLSLKSLMIAKQGFYAENKISGIPDDYLNQYFIKSDTGYQAKPEIMSMINFDYHNLKNDSKRRDIDILFCRNVLIYFDETAQKAVIDRFWEAMSPHSFLFIGHSESLFGMNTKFEFLKTDLACLYQKNTKN